MNTLDYAINVVYNMTRSQKLKMLMNVITDTHLALTKVLIVNEALPQNALTPPTPTPHPPTPTPLVPHICVRYMR